MSVKDSCVSHTNGNIPWLDLCRALAILLVLLSHGRHYLKPTLAWTEQLKFGGFLGVELFFVLSGYLVGGILIRDYCNAKSSTSWIYTFLIRRWFRTIPNYLMFFTVNIILLILGVRSGVADSYLQYLTFTQNFLSPHPSFFPEAWSLSVEEMFYLIVPIMTLLATLLIGKGKNTLFLVILTMFVFSHAYRAIHVFNYNPVWDEGVRKVVLFRLDAIMVGFLLAWLQDRRGSINKKMRIAGFALLPLLFWGSMTAMRPNELLDSSFFCRVFLFTITSFGCAGLILVGVNYTLPRYLSICVSYLAKCSYSAYLCNLPVLFIINAIFATPAGGDFGILKWVIFIIGTLAISAGTYHFFERRMLSLRDKYFPSDSGRFVTSSSLKA